MTATHNLRRATPPVPSMLVGFLPQRLRSVNEESWRALNLVERRRIAQSIIESIRKALPRIRKQVGDQYLPLPPAGITLDDLELEVRTLNCLNGLGFSEDPQLISCIRLKELLATRNFGVRSLVDLLTALDAVGSERSPQRFKNKIEPPGTESQTLREQDVERIKECVRIRSSIASDLRKRCLPNLPASVKINRSELKSRTYNCLKHGGFIRDPHKLSGQTIGSMLGLKAFGKDSLIDLLDWIEPFVKAGEESADRGVALTQALAAEAKMLKNMPDAEMISIVDPRLGKRLRLVDPNARNALEAAEHILSGMEMPSGPNELILNSRRLRENIESLSQVKLEEELLSIVAGETSDRNLEIFVQRYGLNGSPPHTLQELANNWRLTRERVRQICDRVASKFEGRRPFAPSLDKALRLIEQQPVGLAYEIEAQITTQGVSSARFSLESLCSAAILLGRAAPYSIEDIGGFKTLTAAKMVGTGGKILQIARRAVSHWGAVTMGDIISKATGQSRFTAEVVIRVIKGQEHFRWLDESSGWFWLNDVPRNRLLTQIRKVFSVTDELSVSELRAGVRRHHRMEGFAPPERVLIELCNQLQGFTVVKRTIKVDGEIGLKDVLSKNEKIMADILRANSGVMQREPFEEECVANGVNRTTFYAYLNYSPVITKYAVGVYGIRGARVALGLIESLKPRRMKGKVLKDYGWTSQSRVWIGYELSQSMLTSGVFGVPSALGRFVDGDFKMFTPNGASVGNLKVRKTRAWGLRPFLSRKGVDAGDHIVLVYDLASRMATIHVGDHNLLEEFQPGGQRSS